MKTMRLLGLFLLVAVMLLVSFSAPAEAQYRSSYGYNYGYNYGYSGYYYPRSYYSYYQPYYYPSYDYHCPPTTVVQQPVVQQVVAPATPQTIVVQQPTTQPATLTANDAIREAVRQEVKSLLAPAQAAPAPAPRYTQPALTDDEVTRLRELLNKR